MTHSEWKQWEHPCSICARKQQTHKEWLCKDMWTGAVAKQSIKTRKWMRIQKHLLLEYQVLSSRSVIVGIRECVSNINDTMDAKKCVQMYTNVTMCKHVNKQWINVSTPDSVLELGEMQAQHIMHEQTANSCTVRFKLKITWNHERQIRLPPLVDTVHLRQTGLPGKLNSCRAWCAQATVGTPCACSSSPQPHPLLCFASLSSWWGPSPTGYTHA